MKPTTSADAVDTPFTDITISPVQGWKQKESKQRVVSHDALSRHFKAFAPLFSLRSVVLEFPAAWTFMTTSSGFDGVV